MLISKRHTACLILLILVVANLLPVTTAQTPFVIAMEEIAGGLNHPTNLVESPDGTGRLFITDQNGVVYIVTAEGEKLEDPFLNLHNRMVRLEGGYDERGLLGFAFHPDYAENGRFFVYYSAPLRAEAPADWNHTSHLSEFRVSADDPNRADPDSERIIMQIDKPQANHDGGQLAFGEDGYLYIGLGDGGREEYGQDEESILGSILRIDIDNGDSEPYSIPPDNPFLDSPKPDEVYAMGFRHPYRFSFDAETGELWSSDVGHGLREEVNLVQAGGNYGWAVWEGDTCHNTLEPLEPLPSCADTDANGNPFIPPTFFYTQDHGSAIAGGYWYRGTALPDLQGHYVFADWSWDERGGLVMVAHDVDGEWLIEPLNYVVVSDSAQPPFYIIGFGQDLDNELYMLVTRNAGPTGRTGKVLKLIP